MSTPRNWMNTQQSTSGYIVQWNMLHSSTTKERYLDILYVVAAAREHSLLVSTLTTFSRRSSVKVYEGVPDVDNVNDGFWRVALGEHRETCLLMSSKFARLIDFRVNSFR